MAVANRCWSSHSRRDRPAHADTPAPTPPPCPPTAAGCPTQHLPGFDCSYDGPRVCLPDNPQGEIPGWYGNDNVGPELCAAHHQTPLKTLRW